MKRFAYVGKSGQQKLDRYLDHGVGPVWSADGLSLAFELELG
jgi:hypothetical protein